MARATLLAGFVVLGIFFRLWFISLAPQPFGWDQYEYEMYASKIFSHPWMFASHSYRSYPYPLMLALLYKIVGFGNHQAVFFLQAVMDSLVGLMIYVTLKMMCHSRPVSQYGVNSSGNPEYNKKDWTPASAGVTTNSVFPWLGFILYLINPFTSGYVGVLLAEVMTGFFIAGTILLGLFFVKKPNPVNGIAFGLFAGMAAETRNAAFLWTLVPIGLAFFSFARPGLAKLDFWKPCVSVVIGIFLTLLYPLWVNWRDYHELNVTTVDDFYAKEFFQGAIIKKLPPFTYVYPVESVRMWMEYYSEYDPGRSSLARRQMAQKYYRKAWELITADPVDYVKVRFFKMWYVWQKENIFFYTEPGFEKHRMLTYWGNAILLALAVFGLIFWPKQPEKASPFQAKFVKWSIIGTIVYGTFAFSLTHAEYRLTIPFYPLLILAAAVGGDVLYRQVRRICAHP